MVVAAPELVVNTTVACGHNCGDPAAATVPPKFAAEILSVPEGGGAPRTVPGYGLADCTTEAVDLVELKARGREKCDLSEFVGRPVFVRFYLKNVGLYSLQFRERQDA